MSLRETRRILLDGNIVDVERHGDELVAGDGRTVGIAEAVHLGAGCAVQDRLCASELLLQGAGDDVDPAAGTDVLPQAGVLA